MRGLSSYLKEQEEKEEEDEQDGEEEMEEEKAGLPLQVDSGPFLIPLTSQPFKYETTSKTWPVIPHKFPNCEICNSLPSNPQGSPPVYRSSATVQCVQRVAERWDLKWLEMAGIGWKWPKMAGHGWKWQGMAGNYWKWLKLLDMAGN